MSRSIKLSEVQSFIRNGLKDRLQHDFTRTPFRIFRERDLQACVYVHLRKFLAGDHTWEILNEPYLKDLKGRGKSAKPDMVLLRRNKTRLLLEFKCLGRYSGLRRREQRVMGRAVKSGIAKKCYYIEAVMEGTRRTRRKPKAYVNHIVTLEMPQERQKKFRKLLVARRKPRITRRRRAKQK